MNRKKISVFALAALLAVSALGCGGSSSGSNTAENTDPNVTKVKIGIRQDLYPTSYIDEKGNPQGYDIDIIKEVDELLPQYAFEYEAVSQEALLTGLETGTYAAAVAGFYSSDERRAKYLFPEECIGGNIIGLLVREEDADIKDLHDLYLSGKTLEPIATTSGMYGIVVDYNKNHPDEQVELVDSDWVDTATEYTWLEEGRYDAVVSSENVYQKAIGELGFTDLVLNDFTAIKTWSLFHPSQSELAAAYDGALRQLKDNGFITEKSIEFFGQDIIPFIEE